MFHCLGHRLRTWGRLSTTPSLAQDLDKQITLPVKQQGREVRHTLAFHWEEGVQKEEGGGVGTLLQGSESKADLMEK